MVVLMAVLTGHCVPGTGLGMEVSWQDDLGHGPTRWSL